MSNINNTLFLSSLLGHLALLIFLVNQGSDGILTPCHTYLEEEEGFVTSPDSAARLYTDDLECIYDIARSSYDQCGIRLTFEEFKLESHDVDGFCKKDWLSIDSCVPEGGSRFCGEMAHVSYEYPFQHGAEAFRLIFCSGNYTQEKMFRIRYKLLTECNNGIYWDPPVSFIPGVQPKETPCFTQVTEKKGTINTPYYPRHYPNDMDCVYEFMRESAYICGIKMKVISFELSNSIDTDLGGACLDFFHTPGCGFLCGSLRYVWTAKYQPGATSLKFHFHSDENDTRSGFQIAFEQVYNC